MKLLFTKSIKMEVMSKQQQIVNINRKYNLSPRFVSQERDRKYY